MTGSDAVLRILPRLTYRDRILLDWLADHQVLTTPQIDHALFGSPRFTQRRLLDLHRAGLIDRFRALRPGGGSYPWHHVLAPLGAELIAATRDQPPPRRAETTRRIRGIATSRTLDHLLGVNQFFTDLAGHARTHPDAALERWWPETRCAAPGAFAPGLISPVRPDGHGIYREHDRRVAFYLEHDTGSMSVTGAVARKLAGYQAHVTRGGPAWPVLFWLPNDTRETNLRHHLRNLSPTVAVATASQHGPHGRRLPTDPIWHIAGSARGPYTITEIDPVEGPATSRLAGP